MRYAYIFIAAFIIFVGGFALSPYAPWGHQVKLNRIIPYEATNTSSEKVFNASTTTLDNGLQVVVVSNHRAPVITHMVWYKVGAADEPAGSSGIAHFLEHLMFKGSSVIGQDEPLAPGEFSKIIRANGGNDNAFTSQDYTAYFQSIASDQLERVMRMEAGRMRGLNPPIDEVQSERQVILEERRQRTDNDPRGRFREQLAANAFVNHPYGTPVIGWKHEMEELTWKTAKDFYDVWYAPNNATLVVSGDVEAEDVFALANDIYGSIPASTTLPERKRTRSPVLHSKTSVELTHPAIHQPVVQIMYRVPSYHQDAKVSLALEVLSEIMSGGSTSRLYKSLVVDQKIASSAGLSYNGSAWDDAQLWLYAAPLPGQSAENVRNALENELRKLVQDGVEKAERREAISRMQDAAIYARDSLTGPAMVIGQALSTGATLEDVEYWPSKIETVTADQIHDVARQFLNPDAMGDHPPVYGTLLPVPSADPEPSPAPEEAAP